MTPVTDFWASTACFRPPIPEVHKAADMLAEAADALLAANHELARERLRQADMPALFEYAYSIMGRETLDIHRRRVVDAPIQTGAKAAQRKPSATVEMTMYARDGWRCRYCGCRVVLKTARDKFRELLPGAICWSGPDRGRHAAFYALNAVPDHVTAHAIGGGNDLDNLVTACWPCNFGRMHYSLDEFGLIDPRSRQPVVDEWDGLGRLLGYARKATARVTNAARVAEPVEAGAFIRTGPQAMPRRNVMGKLPEEEWFAELDRIQPTPSSRLLAFIESCKYLGISWRLNKILLVRMKVNDVTVELFGINSNGEVNIPWFIGEQKANFRSFAEKIARAIPDAICYETPRTWSVTKPHKNLVNVLELLDASAAVRIALDELNAALRNSS
jgi:hypothetical protein